MINGINNSINLKEVNGLPSQVLWERNEKEGMKKNKAGVDKLRWKGEVEKKRIEKGNRALIF